MIFLFLFLFLFFFYLNPIKVENVDLVDIEFECLNFNRDDLKLLYGANCCINDKRTEIYLFGGFFISSKKKKISSKKNKQKFFFFFRIRKKGIFG